ncbi:CRISPR-associated helicase Cas3, core [Nitrobacter sp. Nb-311A]|uniref:CRISPR-associated endonuclease Cas3'' n=1 Tax=Nitrobacter sp. Nb-311A TaxID=314253 RepID=UPI0000687A2B|nr:CRISPR-associated endonuclease Cas3'' [Nitrobacter sp. Nb-311A]EAQ36305.1 CRISPR-associated helicase Cas3, core [Nitrobacter sp. Nb-311A]
MFFAHSLEDQNLDLWQPLAEHLEAVSRLTSQRSEKFGAGRLGAVIGLLHDLGKYSREFQDYISGKGPSPDHATAGACEIRKSEAATSADRLAVLIGAYCIAGHHSGLPNWLGDRALLERLGKRIPTVDPIWQKQVSHDAYSDLLPKLMPYRHKGEVDKSRVAFQLALFGRMLFSCLVDADYRDTEEFYSRAEGERIDREWPNLTAIITDLIDRFDVYMKDLPARAGDMPLSVSRAQILAHARGKAGLPRGVFTLDVPTGGGKTLASLGFALDHTKIHGMDRIVYGIPFTSIIDQTVEIFRNVLGHDVVLAHHSAIEDERQDRRLENEEGERFARDKMRLAMEDWAAPVVITTNVQLFESLFASRTSRCRKLHNLVNSIIILDEAQTIPRPLLRPCVAALDELVRNYGCSVVLCTATQPALGEPRFKGGFNLSKDRELAPDPDKLATELQRVRLVYGGDMDDTALVGALARTEQGLVIVNSRKHALALYWAAESAGLEGIMHLSTRHYAVHRREILEKVRHALKTGAPCRLIATSLIEAGVDIDFPKGWRAEAGLDQIAQAAGRVNRERTRWLDESTLTVFRAPDYPPPPEIRSLSGDMARMMHKHDNLFSPAAIEDFFGEVYWRASPQGLDAKSIFDDFKIGGGIVDFSYRTVGEKFRMIEIGMVPVIVPGDDKASELIEKLSIPQISSGAIARELQPYIVQVPPKARERLIACSRAMFAAPKLRLDQFAVLTDTQLYRQDVGLLWEDADYLSAEELIW